MTILKFDVTTACHPQLAYLLNKTHGLSFKLVCSSMGTANLITLKKPWTHNLCIPQQDGKLLL